MMNIDESRSDGWDLSQQAERMTKSGYIRFMPAHHINSPLPRFVKQRAQRAIFQQLKWSEASSAFAPVPVLSIDI
jgi:hypothetical protein